MINSELSNYVEEFQNGKKEAFEIIYNATDKQLFSVVYSFTKDEQLTYDLMQETYVTFYSKAESIEKPQYTQKWLNVVAINKAKRYLQSKKRDVLIREENENIFENQEELDEEFLPEEILENKEKQKIIKDIIDTLPLEQKTAVYLYYFNEMSLSEIAEEMDCSEGTVKSRLNYARKKIKAEVDSWEKKGTKLYASGVPILILLLKLYMQEAKAMDLNRSKDILNNIKHINAGTSYISNIKDVHKVISKKIIGSCVAGGLAVSLIIGYQIIKPKNETINKSNQTISIENNNTQDDSKTMQDIKQEVTEKKHSVNHAYISYDDIGISSAGDTRGSNNYVQVKDLPNDRCIEIINTDGLTNKEDTVYIGGKQIDITLEDDGTVSTGYEPNSDITYIAFKEFTDSDILSADGYDSSILDVKVNKNLKNISFTEVSKGETVVNIIDSNGKTGALKIKVSVDEDGVLFPEYTTDMCK